MNQLGYFGKTRHRGDFVRFNLPQTFTRVWDDWLQQIILDGEHHYQAEWKDLYDNAPSQRFVLSSGIAGSQMWIGILLPSQDKVGRRFPFCLTMSLPENNLPCVAASQMTPWFNDAQNLLSRMQASDYDFDQLQTELGHMAEKYEQDDIPSSPLLTTTPNPDSDAIGVSVSSSDPLNNPVATQALLDGLLTQTLGEYSLWMRQDGNNQSLLHGGLPIGQSALAMFTGNTHTSAPTHIDLALLGVNAVAIDSLPMSLEAEQHHSIGLTGDELLDSTMPSMQNDHRDDQTELVGDARHLTASTTAHQPDLAEPDVDLDATLEHQPLDANTVDQTTSADDWAALDDFVLSGEESIEVAIPEVEPLELDEDESVDAEDAPWET